MRPALDWRSACLFATADPDWRRKFTTGAWLLWLPLVGWPIVLGYRRVVLENVVAGREPALPEWRGNLGALLRGGLGAVFVIHAYYAPLYVWLSALVARTGGEVPWGGLLLGLAAFPIASTLLVPAGLAWLRFAAPVAPADAECLALGLAFAVVTFAIPAGFLQVSRTGRLSSAFDLRASLQLIARLPARYVEAWIGSGLMSIVGHLGLPIWPWGIVWCYLGIVFGFNEVPLADPDARAGYLRNASFERLRCAHADAGSSVGVGPFRVPNTR